MMNTVKKHLCIPITFNNLLKACFSNKKYIHITIKPRPTQIVKVFLIEKSVINEFYRLYVNKINYLSLFDQI